MHGGKERMTRYFKILKYQYRTAKKGSSDTEFICGEKYIQHFTARKNDDDYIVINILPDSQSDKLVIKSTDALLYRIELYKGKYAVVNCGMGPCPSFMYTNKHLDKYVMSIKPSLVIAKIFTVNDWISGKTPAECEKSLVEFGTKIAKNNIKLVFSSVIPILGNRENAFKGGLLRICTGRSAGGT